MPEAKPVLQLENVNKRFGGVITAEGVSFEVFPGEIVGLIGPNGAGKTTILNLVSGIYNVDAGAIFLSGKDVTKVPAHKRAHMGLARTFQTPRFLQRSSLHDNMMLGADLATHVRALPNFFQKQDRCFQARVDELMELAGFALDWEEDISSMPYGNRKLLEIVRALLTNPAILLTDEPAAGLNTKELERVVALLRHAARDLGIGIVLIEHTMDMVMNTCHRIVVLNFGRVIAQGTPEAVSADPNVIEAYLGRRRHA